MYAAATGDRCTTGYRPATLPGGRRRGLAAWGAGSGGHPRGPAGRRPGAGPPPGRGGGRGEGGGEEAVGERGWLLEREGASAARAAVDAERARIAAELHDIVSHNVSLMVVQA